MNNVSGREIENLKNPLLLMIHKRFDDSDVTKACRLSSLFGMKGARDSRDTDPARTRKSRKMNELSKLM